MRANHLLLACAFVLTVTRDVWGQGRQCLDLTNDRIVDTNDVRLGVRGVAGLTPVLDPRADFDMRNGVTITDLVNQLLVARNIRPGLIDLAPRAVSPGQNVEATVQNLRTGTLARVTILVGNRTVSAGTATVQDRKLAFRMPAVGNPGELRSPGIEKALPGADRQGLVLVRVDQEGRVSNPCAILVLQPGEGDRDGDGLRDRVDLCPNNFDPQNGDTDGDGIGDVCDNCPASANRDQADRNNDGSGNACQPSDTVFVNGLAIVPPQGVDPRMREIRSARPHGVIVLTRESDMHIEDTLGALNVRLLRPLARNAFVVAVAPAAFDRLGQLRWFRSLFPLDARVRLVGDLRTARLSPGDTLTLDVEFHADVPLDTARALLLRLGAEIRGAGVDLGGPDKLIRRVNVWRVVMKSDSVRSLAALDPVLSIERAYFNVELNANSRAAINIGVLNLAGINGNGMTIGEWDGGWADGDNAAPPAAAPGGVNAALTGRVRVRDHGTLEGIAAPAGCTLANISCDANCFFANHATHVGGTMIGDGTLAGGGAGVNQGMATQAQIVSYEWMSSAAEAVCERQDAITNFATVAHNNSWGYCAACANLGSYNAISSTYDQDIRGTPGSTEVFSAGNAQNQRNTGISLCTGLAEACALPLLYTPAACSPLPPGVAAPPVIAAPSANVANRFYTTGAPGGTAKNVITVGNVDAVNNRLSPSSSLGPTLDGRLKPEVVAHGTLVTSTCVPGRTDATGTCLANGYMSMSGTSMAAPAVTGAVTLLYERAAALGIPFQSSDARALLAHTATDLGVHPGAGGAFLTMAAGQWQNWGAADGPDFLTGYGIVNAAAAFNHLNNGNIGGTLKPSGCPTGVTYTNIPFNSPVAVGGAGPVAGCPAMVWDVVWYITVPAGTNELRVTIAWNDVQATSGANPTIVNDIDLMLEAPGSVYHYPWWTDPACPYRQAVRVQANTFDPATYGDHRNNLEQIFLTGGVAAGTWRVIVRTDGLAAGPQPFSMMISMN